MYFASLYVSRFKKNCVILTLIFKYLKVAKWMHCCIKFDCRLSSIKRCNDQQSILILRLLSRFSSYRQMERAKLEQEFFSMSRSNKTSKSLRLAHLRNYYKVSFKYILLTLILWLYDIFVTFWHTRFVFWTIKKLCHK